MNEMDMGFSNGGTDGTASPKERCDRLAAGPPCSRVVYNSASLSGIWKIGTQFSTVWAWLVLLVATYLIAESQAGFGPALCACLTLICSACLTLSFTNPLNWRGVDLLGLWYLSYLAVVFLPSFFVYADQPGPYRGYFLFGVMSGLITVPVGCVLANLLTRFSSAETDCFFARPLLPVQRQDRMLRGCWCALLALLALTVVYILELKTIPILELLRGQSSTLEIALFREDSLKLLNSPFTLLYFHARTNFFPFLSVLCFGFALSTRLKTWKKLFAATLIAGLFFNSLTAAKGPVALLLICFSFYFYFVKQRHLNVRFVIGTVVAFLTFPISVLLLSTEMDLGTALGAMATRLFYMPAELLYYYFEYFPAQMSYLHGLSIDKLAFLAGKPVVPVDNLIGVYAYPAWAEKLGSISAPAAFLGYFHADFGMPGVLIGGVITGVILQAMHIKFMRLPKTVPTLAAYSLLSCAIISVNFTSLPYVLLSLGALLFLFLGWALNRLQLEKHLPFPNDSRTLR